LACLKAIEKIPYMLLGLFNGSLHYRGLGAFAGRRERKSLPVDLHAAFGSVNFNAGACRTGRERSIESRIPVARIFKNHVDGVGRRPSIGCEIDAAPGD